MKYLLIITLLISSTSLKADESTPQDVKEKLIRLVLLSCMSGVQRAVSEYETHNIKLKIKSGPELCSDLLKDL